MLTLDSGISPLFSLFNHSCEPNVDWTIRRDHTTMKIRVNQDVKQGEQLFVDYDGFMEGSTLQARRKRLRKWLDEGCQCTKCRRQEAEQVAVGENCTCGCGRCKDDGGSGLADWDVAEKPVLPEDSWNQGGRSL